MKNRSTADVIYETVPKNTKLLIFKAKLYLCVLRKLINPCPFYHPPKAECEFRASVDLVCL